MKRVFEDLLYMNPCLTSFFSDTKRLKALGVKMIKPNWFQLAATSVAKIVLSLTIGTVAWLINKGRKVLVYAASLLAEVALGTVVGVVMSALSGKNRIAEFQNKLKQWRYKVHNACRRGWHNIGSFFRSSLNMIWKRDIDQSVIIDDQSQTSIANTPSQNDETSSKLGISSSPQKIDRIHIHLDEIKHQQQPIVGISSPQKQIDSKVANHLPKSVIQAFYPGVPSWESMKEKTYQKTQDDNGDKKDTEGQFWLTKAKSLCNELQKEAASSTAGWFLAHPERRGLKIQVLRKLINDAEKNENILNFIAKAIKHAVQNTPEATAGLCSKVKAFFGQFKQTHPELWEEHNNTAEKALR